MYTGNPDRSQFMKLPFASAPEHGLENGFVNALYGVPAVSPGSQPIKAPSPGAEHDEEGREADVVIVPEVDDVLDKVPLVEFV